MAVAVTRDMASSDWLKLETLCLFRVKSVSVTVLGQSLKVIDQSREIE